MQRLKAFLFLIVVLCMCLAPAVQAAIATQETTETACTDHCCSLPDAEGEGTGEEAGSPCNPFECHTCCFMVLPLFRMANPDRKTAFTIAQSRFSQTYRFSPNHDFWQPPRLCA